MTPKDLSVPTNRAYLFEVRRLENIFMPSEEGMEGGEGRNRVVTPK